MPSVPCQESVIFRPVSHKADRVDKDLAIVSVDLLSRIVVSDATAPTGSANHTILGQTDA
jgi:hypothetical protein